MQGAMRGQGLHVNLDDRIAAIENSRTDKARVFFFLLWPLFARAPRHWFEENFCCRPRVCKVFFFVALRWAPRPFGGARAKKFFVALAPCRRPTGLLLPLPFPGAGAKKKTPWVVLFFCSGPVPAPNGASPSLAFRRGRSKKKNTLGGVFFFCSGPVPAPNGASPSPAFRGAAAKKNTLGGVFFLLRPRADAHSLTAGLGGDASPSPGW